MAAENLGVGEQDDFAPIVAINVTPFVDVVLVLLVIFMVTAPLLMKEVIGVQLPKVTRSDLQAAPTFGLAVTRQGQFLWNGQVSSEDLIRSEVRAALGRDPLTQVVISADQEALHGAVVGAIDLVRAAGVTKFALQVDKRERKP